MGDLPKIGVLRFCGLRLDGERSIASDVSDKSCRGIYAYEFSDGTWYVGKTIDVRNRHQDHLHEYRQKHPPLIMIRMLFAEMPEVSDGELDRLETEAINWFSRHGYDLINKAKTSIPLGSSTASIVIDGEFGVEIPWERSRRNCGNSRSAPLEAFKDAKALAKFRKLLSYGKSERMIELAARFASMALPAPSATAGVLWTATAMPSRGGDSRRSKTVACVSVGNVEMLTVFADGEAFSGFLNVKEPSREADGSLVDDRFCRRLRLSGILANRMHYGSAVDLVRITW